MIVTLAVFVFVWLLVSYLLTGCLMLVVGAVATRPLFRRGHQPKKRR